MEIIEKIIVPYFGIILFSFAVLAYFMEANYKRKNRFFKYGYLLLLLGFLFFLFGENLFAKWWIIDDHEIFKFIGNYETEISFIDFENILLNKSEVGAFGKSARYRPSYYFLRILESIIWKDNPFLWYSFRILIIFLFVISIFIFFIKYLSATSTFLFILWVFSNKYWADIFSKMGPAEVYGVLGFALVLLGAKGKIEDRIKSKRVSFLFYLGIIIMIGSKENFLYFFLAPLVYFIFLITKNRYKRELFGFIFSGAYFTFITLSLFLHFSHSKGDIYGNSTSIESRAKLFVNVFSITETKIILLMIIITIIVFVQNHLQYKTKIKLKMHFIYIVFFLGYYLLNYLFYNGNWPTGMRYDFPGILAYQFIVCFLMIALHFIFLKRIGKVYINIVLILFLSFNLNIKAMGEIRISSLENKRRTIAFTEFLNVQKEKLKLYPNKKVFLLVNQPFDFEPIFSLETFLLYYKVINKKYVVINSIDTYRGFEATLLNSLSNLSINGNKSFLPFQEKEYEKSDCVFYTFRELTNKDFGKSCNAKEIVNVPW